MRVAGGYDQNYVLDEAVRELAEGSGSLRAQQRSGHARPYRSTGAFSFRPAIFFDGTIKGKKRNRVQRRFGLCLKTQHFPDSPNHPEFPTTELKPGQRFHRVTVLVSRTRKVVADRGGEIRSGIAFA